MLEIFSHNVPLTQVIVENCTLYLLEIYSFYQSRTQKKKMKIILNRIEIHLQPVMFCFNNIVALIVFD